MKRFSIILSLSLFFLSGCNSLPDPHICPTVAAPVGQGNVTVEVLAESDSSWDGATLPSYPTEAAQISVVKFTIPPHSKLKWHKHPSINAGYMISGEILVTAEDGQTQVVKAGEGLIETVNTWHYGRNDSDMPAEIVVVYSGVKDRPLAIIRDAQ